MSAAEIETHRSMVKAWECDSFGHFTVAYYFDRVADASATARESFRVPAGWSSLEYLARFVSELRAGEVFHVGSGIIAVENAELRIGHRLVNSATGKGCTSIEEHLVAKPAASASPAMSTAARSAASSC